MMKHEEHAAFLIKLLHSLTLYSTWTESSALDLFVALHAN